MSPPNVPDPDGLEPGETEPTDRDADEMGTELARGEESESDDG